MANPLDDLYGKPFHKMWFGQRAERLQGRLFMQSAGTVEAHRAITVGGVLLGDPRNQRDVAELWEGEIILLPVRKHRDTQHFTHGLGMNGVLTSGGLFPENYGEHHDCLKTNG